MQESLEVLLDRRLGRAQGLGYPWCRASADAVRSTMANGARFLAWDTATMRGQERTAELRALIRRRGRPRDLISNGVPLEPATWRAEGRAAPGGEPATWRIPGRKGWLRWTGPIIETSNFAEVEVRMKLDPGRGLEPGATVSANLRWTDRHYSDGGMHRLARFQAVVDGRWHTYRIDLVRTGWISERLRARTLTLSPARRPVEIRVSNIRLIPW
jgi:hypothetical protein